MAFLKASAPSWSYFRGDSAAASLKPCLLGRLGHAFCRFPRRFRRGLIEAAVKALTEAAPKAEISAAIPPRPH